ncbi:AGE family epimerase/isomerase [Glaciecola sp. 2405UD65-10]|uniref:AGE family epimerase/isomerase n=1 Tax=Glaciecola sp. 2405UD65-10 TaxID=3397244 RepID=UPI003B5C744A
MAVVNKAMLQELNTEFNTELLAIVNWWCDNSVDEDNGGFFGQIETDGTVVGSANKGIILNTRLLWFFSEAALFTKDTQAATLAKRSFHYLMDKFDDAEFGGFVWEVDCLGNLVDGKKQTYAQSFAIYALSAFYQLTGDELALEKAMETFSLLEEKTYEPMRGGYLEAFSRSWQEIHDMRLSEKDANLPKTMNTHLHVLEAYTNLFKVTKDEVVGAALKRLLDNFQSSIVDHSTYHLRLFMCRNWGDHSEAHSYGHDIEASWLLHKSLVVLAHPKTTSKLTPTVLQLAETCLKEGIGTERQVYDEIDIKTGHVNQASCWWVQAEAIVGFLTAYELTGDSSYIDAVAGIWSFIKKHHLDTDKGEWHWLSTLDQDDNYSEYKAGFWKGPYHNGRAMMESIKILNRIYLGS